VPKGRTPKPKIELKYSLLNDQFTSTIGKRLTSNLQNSISKWTKDKNEQNAKELIELYGRSLSAYWKKTKLRDMQEVQLEKDFNLVVDLVYKKGRKPNSIRLDNNPLLKAELLKLHRAK
jgi:hypothetical protein